MRTFLFQKNRTLPLYFFSDSRLIKAFFYSLLFITILFPAISYADADRIFKESNKAVVVVTAYGFANEPIAQGSGFIVRQDGAIVTNYHVVNGSADITITVQKSHSFGDDQRSETLEVEGLIYCDKDNDLVILKAKFIEPPSKKPESISDPLVGRSPRVPRTIDSLPVVRLGDIDKVNVGEKLYVISSPQGLENTISEGIISGLRDVLSPPSPLPLGDSHKPSQDQKLETARYLRKIKYRKKILQITAPVSSGSSGGPAFNQKGEVIGIVTFLIEGGQNLNFAMPVNLIKDEIENKEVIPLKAFQKEFEKEYIKWLAATLVKTEDWSKAKTPKGKEIEVCKEVLRLNPYHVTGRITLILILMYLTEHKEEALKQYEILKVIDPTAAMGMQFLFEDSLSK
ncbi:MAG: trypsin-like peptidase domain-containing protein [Desulfovibrionales bacterium]|nr:trypsin-like peptidase domain-containing protein [Desulfovibrionales bacterium]